MPRKIEQLLLDGPAGKLEALLEEPEEGEPREVALVCHPHPQHGGTMHNKVVYRIARGLRSAGAVVLRFNYRGVNKSEGVYADGEGELEDAKTMLAYLRSRYPELPYSLAGFSFGSRVALRLGCAETAARRVIAVGFPTIYKDRSYLAECAVPKAFVQSTQDEFGPVADLEVVFSGLTEPKQLHLVQASDHFFADNLEGLEAVIRSLDR